MSPAGKDRATDAQRQVVCSMVNIILNQMQVDFLALGEISEKDVKVILENCQLANIGNGFDFAKVGRSRFDTGFLYRRDKLVLIDPLRPIITNKGNRTLKLAQRADFTIRGCDKSLHVFISHWPSLLWCPESSADRHLLSIKLREMVEEVSPEHGKIGNVILLGDYNAEPYNDSFAEQLMATRDRVLARKMPNLLYNPFWRHLGFSKPYSSDMTDEGSGGTYFHKNGKITRWRTFDQIIFSSAFLGHTEWHLNEDLTGILDIEKDLKIFDHFPVYGVIEKVQSHG